MSRSVYFTAPGRVEVREEGVPSPGPEEVQIRGTVSAISAGTEMLFYRGQVAEGMTLDTTISSLRRGLHYPFRYGYSTVGVVVNTGEGVSPSWSGQRVFALHGHESLFNSRLSEVWAVPTELDDEDAVFLAGMETALSLVMDAAPLVGERAVIMGQGTIGLLTTSILARMPLTLVVVDPIPARRERGEVLGAGRSIDPSEADAQTVGEGAFVRSPADLVIEVSGDPRALDLAARMTGTEGRIVVGSWYGGKQDGCHLGEEFHRKRLRIFSSQVSHVGGTLAPRWSKERRMGIAWEMMERVRPSRLITHRFHVEDAPQAYELIDRHSEEVIQVILTYGES